MKEPIKATVVAPDSGETFQVGPITIRVLEDGSNTDNRIGIVEIRVPPGTNQTPPHFHTMHDETFIVTQGLLRFTMGTEYQDVETGGGVIVPIRVPHTFSNPFTETAIFINTFSPAFYVNYLRELSRLVVTQNLTPDRILGVMARYATQPALQDR